MPASGESVRQSYIRATRKVVPSTPLRKTLERIENRSVHFLGYRDTALDDEALTLEAQLEQAGDSIKKPLGIPVVDVFKTGPLWVTLFQLRRANTARDNNYLERLGKRLRRLDLSKFIDPEPPVATARTVVETTEAASSSRRRKFGLQLDDGPMTRNLQAIHEALYAEADNKVGSKRAASIDPEDIPDPTVFPIFSLPSKADRVAVGEFITHLNQEFFFGTYVSVEFNGLAWPSELG